MERTIKFVANGTRCSIRIETPRKYQSPDGERELSMSGDCAEHGGQCDSTIREAIDDDAPDVARMLEIWAAYHLKPVPLAIVDELSDLADKVEGKRYGHAPGLDDAPEFDSGSDVIDSRDVVRRTEIFREAVAAMGIDPDAVNPELNVDGIDELSEDDIATVEEYAKLKELDDAGSNSADDWQFGETLIRDSYFKDYARELADDIGATNSESTWPNNYIDWDAAADALQQDYTSIEFDGVTFWVR